MDYPAALAHARRLLRRERLAKDFEFIPGEFYSPGWRAPEGYDLAWVSGVLHVAGRDENLTLLRRLHKGLAAGGQLLIGERTSNGNLRENSMFDVEMYLMTLSGRVYASSELLGLMRAAGFRGCHALRQDETSCVVRGFKTGARP